jgi:hypothetical protein
MTGQTETSLPWGQDTITIKGRNAGIQHLTVYYDDEELNIIDFLNNSLMVEYFFLFEKIMSACEAKLNNADPLDYNFPDTKFAVKKIDPLHLNPAPADDKGLIDILLKKYQDYLDYLKVHFKRYEGHVARWFNTLPADIKNPI